MKKIWLWLPFLFFAGLLTTMASHLQGQDRAEAHQSKLIGKPIPNFSLPAMLNDPNHPGLGSATFRQGQPRLLNFFASWCIPCIAEAPHLLRLAKMGVPIDAVAIRDKPVDVARFLRRHGNPYDRIGSDPTSHVQIAMGASGVPETFVIDGRGIVRHHHVGDIRAEDVAQIAAAVRMAAR